MVKCRLYVIVEMYNAEAQFTKDFVFGFLPREKDRFLINDLSLGVVVSEYCIDDDIANIVLQTVCVGDPRFNLSRATLAWLRERNFKVEQLDEQSAAGFKELQAEITRLKFEEQSDE